MTYPTEITTPVRYPPVIERMAIDVGGGVVLEGNCDVDLARKWAAHQNGTAWQSMSMVERSDYVAAAIHELRRAHYVAGDITTVVEPDTATTTATVPTPAAVSEV